MQVKFPLLLYYGFVLSIGTVVGFQLAKAAAPLCAPDETPCPYCNFLDGILFGPQAHHACTYRAQCSCVPGTHCPVEGWCRHDDCKPCPGTQLGGAGEQCQTDYTCHLSSQQYSLCTNACS